MKDFNTYYFTTGFWTQSGGIIRDLWGPVLSSVRPAKHAFWLILGLSGGTVAGIISKKYSPAKIVGVELDPIMINLGKKYLNLDKIPHLKIVNNDANYYLQTTNFKYDYALIDMYIGETPPEFIYTDKFLHRLKQQAAILIFNHLFYTSAQKLTAEKFINRLDKIFSTVKLQRRLTNILIICS